MTPPDLAAIPTPADWPARYDAARIQGARRPQALREAVGVNDQGETL